MGWKCTKVYDLTIRCCEELRVLCADVVLVSNQWGAIAKIAINEGWSFTFFPDRSVRFAKF
jgi:hypothetical protein